MHVPWHEIERIVRATYTWMALLAIIGWSRVLLDKPLRWLPYCSEAVFSWYILHQTLIVVLAYLLIPMRLGPVIEPVLTVSGTVVGCLVLHELLIRRIALLRPLFGLKWPGADTGMRDPRNQQGHQQDHQQRQAGSRWTTTSCTASPPR
jgi:hypothetical protein